MLAIHIFHKLVVTEFVVRCSTSEEEAVGASAGAPMEISLSL